MPLEGRPELLERHRAPLRQRHLSQRDDLTGVGGGGNKLRKLEYTAGAALREGADTLVTVGAPQSNHARLTAAVAAKLGMRSVLILSGTPGASSSGNLVLDGLLGARVVWAGERQPHELTRTAEDVVADLRSEGRRPVLIPFGGSSPLAARGYVTCAEEILDQVPAVGHVVVAVGSGGTMAGLVAGLGAERVLGIDVGAQPDARAAVASFASAITDLPITPESLRLHDQTGAGYSIYTEDTEAALLLAARTEGVILDPTYTGRAMAGLLAAVRNGVIKPGQPTVFLHTGGLPGLFGHQDAVARALNLL